MIINQLGLVKSMGGKKAKKLFCLIGYNIDYYLSIKMMTLIIAMKMDKPSSSCMHGVGGVKIGKWRLMRWKKSIDLLDSVSQPVLSGCSEDRISPDTEMFSSCFLANVNPVE